MIEPLVAHVELSHYCVCVAGLAHEWVLILGGRYRHAYYTGIDVDSGPTEWPAKVSRISVSGLRFALV
jgi:hypothetical protein